MRDLTYNVDVGMFGTHLSDMPIHKIDDFINLEIKRFFKLVPLYVSVKKFI